MRLWTEEKKMPTVEDCQKCTKPCPQAERAHETAKGRMYATNELTVLLKKVECGQLVEVVRCGECKHYHAQTGYCDKNSHPIELWQEKITDSINYLLLLNAMVRENQ